MLSPKERLLNKKMEKLRRSISNTLSYYSKNESPEADLSLIKQNLQDLADTVKSNAKAHQKLFGTGTGKSFRNSEVGKLITEEVQKSNLLNAKRAKSKSFPTLNARQKKALDILGGINGKPSGARSRAKEKGEGVPTKRMPFNSKGAAFARFAKQAARFKGKGPNFGAGFGVGLLFAGLGGAAVGFGAKVKKKAEELLDWMFGSGEKKEEAELPQTRSVPQNNSSGYLPYESPGQKSEGSQSGNYLPYLNQEYARSPNSPLRAEPLSAPPLFQKKYDDLPNINTRAARNINPGNVKAESDHDYMGQVGRDNKNHAIFATKEAGVAAIVNRLFRYNADKKPGDSLSGKKTLREIMYVYAPKSENNTEAYIQNVSKKIGIGPDEHIELTERADLLAPLAKAIMHYEDHKGRKTYDDATIDKGVEIAMSEKVQGKEFARNFYKEFLRPGDEYAPEDGPGPIAEGNNPYSKSGAWNQQPTIGPLSDLNERLYVETKNAQGRYSYGYGNKGENGSIDCSGWVQMAMRKAGVAPNLLSKLQGKTAAEQVLETAKETNSRIDVPVLSPSLVREGMLVGVKNNASRESKIGHVGIVLRNPDTGELGVSHSSKSKGVNWQPLNLFQRDFGKYGFVLSDPFIAQRGQETPALAERTPSQDNFSFENYARERGVVVDPLSPTMGLTPEYHAKMQQDYKREYRKRFNTEPPPQTRPTVPPLQEPQRREKEVLAYKAGQAPNLGAVPQQPLSPDIQAQLNKGTVPSHAPTTRAAANTSPTSGTIPDKKPPWTNLFEGASAETKKLFTELGDVFT